MKQKVYELTTNEKDGYVKYYVRGIKSSEQAKSIGLKGFGKYYFSGMVSYYDDYPSEYGHNWKKNSFTIKQFLKKTKNMRKH